MGDVTLTIAGVPVVVRGTPGHFIAAHRCDVRLHCALLGYRVSTVGLMFTWYGRGVQSVRDPSLRMEAIGSGRYSETMVFVEVDGEVLDWSEVTSASAGMSTDVAEIEALHWQTVLAVARGEFP